MKISAKRARPVKAKKATPAKAKKATPVKAKKAAPVKGKRASSRTTSRGVERRSSAVSAKLPVQASTGVEIARIAAVMRHGGTAQMDYRAVLLCGIDSDQRIVDGEWMGYMRSPSATYPFVLTKEGSDADFAFEGGEEDKESTTVGRVALRPGEFFTVFAALEHEDEKELVFEIVSCHRYA